MVYCDNTLDNLLAYRCWNIILLVLIIIRLMLKGVGLLSASLPVSLKSRYARVRDGWTIGSSEAWVTSRLVAFSNKRDASS